MGRLGILGLPFPGQPFRPDSIGHTSSSSKFETPEESRIEDAYRIRAIRKTLETDHPLIDRSAAANLAERLDYASNGAKRPDSMACSLYMGGQRVRIGGALWKLAVEPQWGPASVFTAIPRGWEFTPEQLNDVSPIALMEEFRSALNRDGAAEADGYLAAFLHGEFEPNRQVYQLHLHGLAAGSMIEVLERLKQRASYKSTRPTNSAEAETVRQRLSISRKPLTNLPGRVTYCIQSFWPARRIGSVDDQGTVKRGRQKRRIPEPFHTQVLLWLDKWNLENISVLRNLSVTKNGLIVASGNPYTKKEKS